MSMLARAYLHLRMESGRDSFLSLSLVLSLSYTYSTVHSFVRKHIHVLYARDYKSRANEWLPFVITAVGTPVRWAPT